MTTSGVGASYTGGIIGNINTNVPNVTAFDNNGYLQLTTTENMLTIDTESISSTLIDSELGILSDVYYNNLTIDEIYNDLVSANIADLFITKNRELSEVTMSGQYANRIEVKKGIGDAFRALHFTDPLNNEVTRIDNRVLTMDNVIKDINAAITNDDFTAGTDINGNLQMIYNGTSLSVSGTALPGLGLQTQTSTLAPSAIQSHQFKHDDVIVLNNVIDKDAERLDMGGGYVVEERVVYVNKAVDSRKGGVTITD